MINYKKDSNNESNSKKETEESNNDELKELPHFGVEPMKKAKENEKNSFFISENKF